MARKYLGPTFDIHGGGIDNIYPHNENEIAQSECANDATFANYWMLVGSLMVPDPIEGIPIKMSKSLGNFVTVKDALKEHRPEVIRYFNLSAHYSNPVTYQDDSLVAASNGWDRLYGAVRQTRQRMNHATEGDEGNAFLARLETAKQNFAEAMDDDFNAPRALAVLQELTRDVNTLLNGDTQPGLAVLDAINTTYNQLGGDVLGIIPAADATAGSNGKRESGLIELLINMRSEARAQKNYAESDRIRDELANLGVILEDSPKGTIWRAE
jgi:cysteinyl-tRNA synthetase